MIYEGTNGIQSIDLLGRKISMTGGLGYKVLQKKISATVENGLSSDNTRIRNAAKLVQDGLQRHISVTENLFAQSASNPTVLLANSHEYLNFTGHVVVSWVWLMQGLTASCGLKRGDINQRDADFYNGKLISMDYFCKHELVKTVAQAELLRENPVTNLEMHNAYF